MTQVVAVEINKSEFFADCNSSKRDNLLTYRPLAKQHNENTQCWDGHVSKEHLSSLVSHSSLIMFCVDQNFNITNCSSTALFWLNHHFYKKSKDFSFEAIVGKNFKDIFSLSKSMETAFKQALEGKASWHSEPLEYETEDANYWLKWGVFPWLSKNNEITDILIFLEDTTSHQELLLSHKKLQQNNELLESFSLILAHDLMQPLRQVSSFLDIIQENYQGAGPSKSPMNHIFSTLQKSFDHLRNLSEGISLYCKEGDLTVKPERIYLRSLIEELHESVLKTEKYQLNLHLSEDIYLYANRTCMLQLFQNLLANAIKHSTDDNCTITLSGAKENEIFYKFHLHNHGYCPSSIRKKNVFLPFQSSASEGAGLGLMICKKIVSAYKGKITFHSEKHKGTVVSFTLPVYRFEKSSQKNMRKIKKGINTSKYSWH